VPRDVHGDLDTVKAYGWMWPQSFPALRHNPSVEMVRHAVALDEHRAVFQMTGWGDRRPVINGQKEPIKEVWFAGDHSDVGGGHVEGNSRLADATLAWMLGEATAMGLRLGGSKQNREEITKIVDNARSAASDTPRDLRREHWYWRIPMLRAELDNETYPPRRWPRLLPTAVREPASHREGGRVLFHESVRVRGLTNSSYSAEVLMRRGQRSTKASGPDIGYKSDSEITKFGTAHASADHHTRE
jgi:hypothetical protein